MKAYYQKETAYSVSYATKKDYGTPLVVVYIPKEELAKKYGYDHEGEPKTPNDITVDVKF